MKKFYQILYIMILTVLISGCATTKQPILVDSNLPVINDIKTIYSSNSVGLEWTFVKNLEVRGFEIYRAELNSQMQFIARIDDRFATHFLDTNLKPNTTYKYMIKTFSDRAVSNVGTQISVTTTKGIDTVSFAKAIYGLPERVKIIWRPHSNLKVSSYLIERKNPESTKWSKIAEVEGRLSAEYIDKNVKSGQNYDYRILVKTLDGEISEPTQILSATTKELPLGATNLQATIDQPKKIILTWDSPENENFSHYQIYSSRSKFLPFRPLAKSDKNFYEDLINSNGATRYYKVTFVDMDGLESLAQDDGVMGQTLQAPPAPVLGEPLMSGDYIVLNWHTTGNPVDSFVIERSGGGNDKKIYDIKGTSYVDMDVVRGSEYKYRIYGIDKYGISSSGSNQMSIEF
ncbi:fibronectin type III domain-containing protein [Campylobacter sp. FMV-PI01]|uniref:Fibronectin type III domain-containing protein n=1 Tax=Campylobacter portucalensis TaxID=2608384 RepID=A0A6L5WHW2_9BACT|nr:fibronectin type III domain-containing protein [Campylobacter portucalensis]MSN96496.1 fibronectin type III domain-containing protein [Campylobacter portucalensis]